VSTAEAAQHEDCSQRGAPIAYSSTVMHSQKVVDFIGDII
jgi:hypothetical protein